MDFVKEFRDLYFKCPQITNWTRASENCDYGDCIVVSRDSYMCFNSANLEHCMYTVDSRKSRFCHDADYCEDCELCYESIDCLHCYNSDYCQDCRNCSDCDWCYYCIGCTDCFGCVNVKRKKFHIFNKKYSENEYRAKVAEFKNGPREQIEAEFERLKLEHPRVYMHQQDNQNCFGDYLYHSKNSYHCFDSFDCEDAFYIYNASFEHGARDSMDCGPFINDGEQCYGCCWVGFLFNCQHLYWTDRCHDSQWLSNCFDSHHLFGCTYLKNKEYMILNKKVPKDEYDKKTRAISKELKKRGIVDLYDMVFTDK